jgi:2-C-methyl-D-erythritol 4-phosphate cytidylyltransferase
MNTPLRVWAVILAAGSGQRMGAAIPKQYLMLNGQPLLQATLNIFNSVTPLQGSLLVLAPNDVHKDLLNLPSRVTLVTGGAERAQSALNALNKLVELGHGDDWVLMHDGARPCVHPLAIQALIERVMQGQTETPKLHGAILALPLSDTLKQAQEDTITATLNRNHIWAAHTPQMFQVGYLQQAIINALNSGVAVTDEASAVEVMGGKIALVQDTRDNIKVTRPEDLALAEFILKKQKNI